MTSGRFQKIVFIFSLIPGMFLPALSGAEKTPFQIGDLEVLPGEMKSGFVIVSEKEDAGSRIPVTVIHGAKSGKVLALVAGVHGYEYPPILSLYRIKKMIRPDELSGTLVLVHIAHLPAFQKRMIYYNPSDWKNLNRVFPGDPDGTQSQRTAYALTEEIVKKCDALIDLHCGDGNEALVPYSYWMISEDETINRQREPLFEVGRIQKEF